MAPLNLPPDAQAVWQGTLFTAWQWEQELFDGTTKTFEALTRPDSAFTVGVLPDKQILLVEDIQPHRARVLTPAGGRVEPHEPPEAAATREFLEETGYRITRLKPWFKYTYSSKVLSTTYIFIGQDLEQIHSPENSPGEKITLKTYSWSDFLELGRSESLRDQFLRITLLMALLDEAARDNLEELFFT